MERYKYLPIFAIFLAVLVQMISCNWWQQKNIIVEEFPICTYTLVGSSPAISGNIVVWADDRYEAPGIYGYDLAKNTEFVIYTVKHEKGVDLRFSNADVDGNIVVWQQYSYETGYDIWGYNLSTRTEFPVFTGKGDQTMPKISGNFICWIDTISSSNGVERHICIYDILTGKILTSIKLVSGYSYDFSGDIVVWIDNGIKGYDIEKKCEFPISTSNWQAGFVRISGNTVIWVDTRPTSHLWEEPSAGNLIAYDLVKKEEFRLPRTWTYIDDPVVSGDLIVWRDGSGFQSNIYGYDLGNKIGFPINIKDSCQGNLDIYGNIVIWEDSRHSHDGFDVGISAIYGARISRGIR